MTTARAVLVTMVILVTFAAAQGPVSRNSPPAPRAAPSGRPFPVSFTDVAKEAGLRISFTSGNEQSKKYIIEANGMGVAFLDYDNDGRQDIFLVNGSRFEPLDGKPPTNHLYRNLGNGRFDDVTASANLAHSGWGNGVCVADFDNDGFDDIYVTYWGSNLLYRNNGKGAFEDVSARAGVAGSGKEWSSGC